MKRFRQCFAAVPAVISIVACIMLICLVLLVMVGSNALEFAYETMSPVSSLLTGAAGLGAAALLLHFSRNAASGCFESPVKRPEKTMFIHCFPDSLSKVIAKARQGNGGPRTCKFCQCGIYPHRRQQNAQANVACQNTGRGQFCSVYQYLSDDTEDAAAQKRVQILHTAYSPIRSMVITWEIPGMLSP